MDDFQNIEEEYKFLENTINLKIKNIKSINDKILGFQTCASLLRDIILSIPDLSNSPFYFFDDILKKFIKLLEENIFIYKEKVLEPLDSILNNFAFITTENLKTLNKMKNTLFDEKQNLNEHKNKYLNFSNNIKNPKNINKNKINKSNLNNEDEKIFNEAKKANFGQLYQYELDKMNEMIEENNNNYNNIYEQLNAVNSSSIIQIKEKLIEFAKIIKNTSEKLNNLSSDIIKEIDLSEKLNTNQILKMIETNNQKIQIRFKNEIIDNNIFENNEIKPETIEINNNKIKNVTNKWIQMDLEIEKEKEKKENFINDIIDKFFNNNEEVKSKNISKLFIIFKKEENIANSECCQLFLDQIQDKCAKKIIFVKNYKNFIHFSNILNDLCLNHEEIFNIFYIIIDSSQKICFKNKYLSSILKNKNEFFKTKKFWVKLIDEHLMDIIIEYIKKMIYKREKEQKEKKINKNKTKKEEETKEEKEKEKDKKKENEEETNHLKKFLKKKEKFKIVIKELKKLNKIQNKELEKSSSKIICDILSKLIPLMICFIENKEIIEEIINNYRLEFNFNENQLLYSEEILEFHLSFQNQNNSYNNDLSINNEIIISSVSHYLPLNEYPNLLKLNKQIYKNYRDNLFMEAFSYKKIPIKIILQFWYKYLKIEENENNFIYKDIKSGINLSIDQKQFQIGAKQLKIMEIIQQDLQRTLFIIQNPLKFDSFKSILNCFFFSFPQIGYCQGMNYIVSFLYQLLDNDEQKTFNYLCCFAINTKYSEIFEDDFKNLKIYFNVFNYLLKIMRPEIYYKYINTNLLPNCYATSWFITLFTEYVEIINNDDPPLLSIFILNRFFFEGWAAIFNFGMMLMELSYEKIMTYKSDKLFSYVMNIIKEENIFDNKNFEKCQNTYLKNTKIINKNFIDKLIDIEKLNFQINDIY